MADPTDALMQTLASLFSETAPRLSFLREIALSYITNRPNLEMLWYGEGTYLATTLAEAVGEHAAALPQFPIHEFHKRRQRRPEDSDVEEDTPLAPASNQEANVLPESRSARRARRQQMKDRQEEDNSAPIPALAGRQQEERDSDAVPIFAVDSTDPTGQEEADGAAPVLAGDDTYVSRQQEEDDAAPVPDDLRESLSTASSNVTKTGRPSITRVPDFVILLAKVVREPKIDILAFRLGLIIEYKRAPSRRLTPSERYVKSGPLVELAQKQAICQAIVWFLANDEVDSVYCMAVSGPFWSYATVTRQEAFADEYYALIAPDDAYVPIDPKRGKVKVKWNPPNARYKLGSDNSTTAMTSIVEKLQEQLNDL